MTLYEIMLKTNSEMIKGKKWSDAEKKIIANRFLEGVSSKDNAYRFYSSLKFPGNIDDKGRRMYPVFYIPPYNEGKKYRTVTYVQPETHILSANSYELEILRLLSILDAKNEKVREMLEETRSRLKTTCFGNSDDGKGECFEASMIVLRFINTAFSEDRDMINGRLMNFKKHYADIKRPSGVLLYYWLCLSELPESIALPEIKKYEFEMMRMLNISFPMDTEKEKYIGPLYKYIVRNALSRIPAYNYLAERIPFISEKDGRLQFDTRPETISK